MTNTKRMYIEIWIDYFHKPTIEQLKEQIQNTFIESIPLGDIDHHEIEITDVEQQDKEIFEN